MKNWYYLRSLSHLIKIHFTDWVRSTKVSGMWFHKRLSPLNLLWKRFDVCLVMVLVGMLNIVVNKVVQTYGKNVYHPGNDRIFLEEEIKQLTFYFQLGFPELHFILYSVWAIKKTKWALALRKWDRIKVIKYICLLFTVLSFRYHMLDWIKEPEKVESTSKSL